MDSVSFAVTALAMLSCLAMASDATKKSRICSIKNWPKCAQGSTNATTDSYAITPSSSTFRENELISLKVYNTECPTAHTQGLGWYKIEALINGTSVSVGSFLEPIESKRLEAYSCRNYSTIVFQSCEPHPMDLPRQYTWIAPDNNQDTVCFRMTVASENGCSYTETCIAPWNETTSENSQPDGFGADGCTEPGGCASPQIEAGDAQSGGSGAQRTTNLNSASRCSSKWNCTNARLRTFCGSDKRTYTSRCQMRLQECITGTEIRIKHIGECHDETLTENRVCEETRQILEQAGAEPYWLPACDCNGLFKPIQCDRDPDNSGQLECWCSYVNSISEIAGTRRKIVQQCTDPASFEFNCNSV